MHGNVLKAPPPMADPMAERKAGRASGGSRFDSPAELPPEAPPRSPSGFPPDSSRDSSPEFPAGPRLSGPPPSDPPPPDSPPGPSPDIQVLRLADRAATLRRATGSDDARVHDWLVNDLSFALNMSPVLDTPARADRVCAAVSAMCDIGPRDTLEGMLAAQMVAVHSAALDCLRRSAEPISADRARDADLRQAARLLNVFQRQMRVRDDRRNPVLARSLTGRHAPDAAGAPPGARVAPEAGGAGEGKAETRMDTRADSRANTGAETFADGAS